MDIARIASQIENAEQVYVCGNGGSAATAEHFTNDLFSKGVKAHCLNSNTSIITMLANDYGYEYIFSEQLKIFATSKDLLIVFSVSGTSANIVNVLNTEICPVVKFFGDKDEQYKAAEDRHIKLAHQISQALATPLCKLAYNYGTDKCPKLKHNFTPFYYDILRKDRYNIKKVVEVGIGNYKDMAHVNEVYDPGLNRTYKKGASLKMWRDFFPNAQIFGADYVPQTMFEAERIQTFLCNERKEEDIKALITKTGSDIDLFIDDAFHRTDHQVFLAKTALPLLDDKVLYIIEDVKHPEDVVAQLKEHAKEYDYKIIECSRRWKDDHLVIIRKK